MNDSPMTRAVVATAFGGPEVLAVIQTSHSGHELLREFGAEPVLYGAGLEERVLAETAAAHRALATGHTRGKIVLVP